MKIQPIPVESYFLHFPDELLDQAKTICESKLLRLSKRDKRKGYWLFRQEEPELLEVELLTSKSKIKSHSCDCHHFQANQRCAHVVAAIQEAILMQEQDRPPMVKRSNPRHLQTKAILQHTSDKALRDFVLHYAAEHPHFALMLKGKFAHSIEIEDNLSKYFGLCKRYASTLGTGKLSSAKLKKLTSYIEDLLYLADDLHAMGNYRESYHLIYGLLRFCNLRYVVHGESDLQPILLRIHQKLSKLMGAAIAPDLRKEIQKTFLALIEDERYAVFHTQNLYALLVQFSIRQDDKIKVIKLLKEYLVSNRENNEAIFSLFEIYHRLGEYHSLKELIFNHQENFSIVQRSLEWLDARGEMHPTLLKISEQLYVSAPGPKLKLLSFRYLSKLTNEGVDRVNICVDFFLSNRKMSTYRSMRDVLQKETHHALHQILPVLELENDYQILCLILSEEKQWDRLLEVQQQKRDLDLLLTSITHLYQHKYEATETLLLDLVREFLQIHVGQNAFDHINRIIKTLHRGQMRKLITAMHKMIGSDFRERTLLMRSLNN